MTSIQEVLKTRVISQVVTAVKPVASKWKVLIADALARKVLYSCLKISDILEHNVTIVEMLELKRQPFPDRDAVYLLAPTPESVDLLLNDYTKGKPPYAAAHLFFISALSDTLFEKIQKSPIQKHVQTLKELNMDFLALEPQAFTVDLPLSLHAILNAQTPSHLNYELTPIAKRLVSVLASLGEYPSIRYYSPPSGTLSPSCSLGVPLVEKLSRMIQDELDELARIDKSFPPPLPKGCERAILLIVDRGVDIAAPLLHEFTYQAMVHDCLKLEDGCKITNKHDEGKLAILDENDKIWVSQKYEHIADVMQYIGEGVKKFTTENKAASFATGNSRGTEDQIAAMKETLSSLPEYQEMKAKFSLHSDMCTDMMSIFGKYQHQLVSGVEQNLVTGEDSDFKPVKNISVAVETLLANRTVCHEDKLRLLMLYIVSSDGLPDEQRQRLFDLVQLSREEYQAVTNLSVLGVKLSESMDRRGGSKTNPYLPSSLKGGRGRVKEVKFENSRYIPIIKHILEDQTKNNVDVGVFPWIKEPPPSSRLGSSLGRSGSGLHRGNGDEETTSGIQRTKPSWATARAAAAAKASAPTAGSSSLPGTKRPPLDAAVLRANGPRIILFILGGMTHSELRAANEIMYESRRDILIGSTHVLDPHSFLDSLKTLHKARPQVLNTPFPYDPKPEKPLTPPRSKSEGRGKSKDRARSDGDGRSHRDREHSESDLRSKSRRDDGGRQNPSERRENRRYDDRDERRHRNDRDNYDDRQSGRNGNGNRDDYDRGGSRNGSYREDERGGSSRKGSYDDYGRKGSYDDNGRKGSYDDYGRKGSYDDNNRKGSYDDRYEESRSRSGRGPPTGPPRAKSRDERGGSSRGGRREDISDRFEQVSLNRDEKPKKKGLFGLF